MKIFKFGGVSVKDAEGINNIANVLQTVGYEDTLIVVSAMGKTTNALEIIVRDYSTENRYVVGKILEDVRQYHYTLLEELFENKTDEVYSKVDRLFSDMDSFLTSNESVNRNYIYDQIVCFGELLSTTIVSAYFNHIGISNVWIDVRNLIKTNDNYQDASVQWDLTVKNISQEIRRGKLYLTQGFLGSDTNNFTTTLGREGSDYTASIFGYCINAEHVTIWKDVPGVLSADPRYFEKTELLKKIPYDEAIELAFYGASVIHPKTLQPLQKKQIPLYVKSFLNPISSGTCVCKSDTLQPLVSCFIVKKNQKALFLSTRDFSFMVENNISEIFQLLHKHRIKVDMLQSSAISFSICVDDKWIHIDGLLSDLNKKFQIEYFDDVSLYTVRHATDADIKFIEKGKKILLKQRFGNTFQMVVRE